MNKLITTAVAAGIATLGGTASASTGDDNRWYFAPSFSYTYPENDRSQVDGKVGQGLGWRLAAGKMLSKHFNAELNFQRQEFPRKASNAVPGGEARWDLYSLGLEGHFVFNRRPAFSPFLGLGAGYSSSRLKNQNEDSTYVDAIVGVTSAFTEHGTAVRFDFRYRFDFYDDLPGTAPNNFRDMIFNLGLQIPLGSRPEGYNSVNQLDGDFDNRFYLSPMVSYIFGDADRGEGPDPLQDADGALGDEDGGYGIQLGLGRPVSKRLDVELKAVYDELKFTRAAGDETVHQTGASVGGLYHFSRNAGFSPYIGSSIGALRSSFNGVEGNRTGLTADFGVGFKSQITKHGTAVRAEARYRIDDFDDLNHETTWFGDFIASLGLAIPLGARPMAGPADTDGDGVIDPNDKCPGTPLGTAVDADGCALILDSDGDGVPDNRDRCPNTRAGAKVDVSGCEVITRPAPVVTPKPAPSAELVIVYFDFDKANLTPAARRKLDGVAANMGNNPVTVAVATGHADALGSVEYNQNLSERRAAAVQSYLARRGIAASRVTTSGRSELQPAASNADKNGRALNRRVEIRVLRQR